MRNEKQEKNSEREKQLNCGIEELCVNVMKNEDPHTSKYKPIYHHLLTLSLKIVPFTEAQILFAFMYSTVQNFGVSKI